VGSPDVPFRWFGTLLLVLLAGYMFFGRSFAYLHVPGTPVFIGEVVLFVGVIEAVRYHSYVRGTIRSDGVLKALLAFGLLGVVGLSWNVTTYGIDAIRDSAIWYYGAYSVLVATMIRLRPDYIDHLESRFHAVLPYFLRWAPVAVVITRMASLPNIPGTQTALNSYKPGDIGVFTALALAYLWIRDARTRPRWQVYVLTFVGVVALLVAGSQNRGGFVSALAALAVVLLLWRGRQLMVVAMAASVILVVLVALTLDLRLSVGAREVSVVQVAENVVSLLDRDSAAADGYLAGTVEWRQNFWRLALDDALSPEHALIGQGYGPILASRYGYQTAAAGGVPLRSVHNSHLTILVRGGVPTAIAWLFLWGAWYRRTIRIARSDPDASASMRAIRERSIVLLAGVTGILVNAVFDPTLEGPQVAIWVWCILALGLEGRPPPAVPYLENGWAELHGGNNGQRR
jgi:O-antigen ligase